MISTPRNLTKRVAVGATAAIVALQVFAGASRATVPDATATAGAIPPGLFSPGGNAGFETSLTYTDTSTLAKAYLEVDIFENATGIPLWSATKNGTPVANACSVHAATSSTPLNLECSFKTVRTNDVLSVSLAVTPTDGAEFVAAFSTWSGNGFTLADRNNTSHGDTWTDASNYPAVSHLNTVDPANRAYGYGNASLSTDQHVSKTNPQAARLAQLPAGVAAGIIDNAPPDAFTCTPSPLIDCSALSGDWVSFDVGNNRTFASAFLLQITYESSGSPKGFVHVYPDAAGNTVEDFIGPCPKKGPKLNCFDWLTSTKTATLYLIHNSGVRKL